MKKKYKIWHLDAYRGRSDYDGLCDCNKHLDLIMDSSFSRSDVIDMWIALNSDDSCVAVGNMGYEQYNRKRTLGLGCVSFI